MLMSVIEAALAALARASDIRNALDIVEVDYRVRFRSFPASKPKKKSDLIKHEKKLGILGLSSMSRFNVALSIQH